MKLEWSLAFVLVAVVVACGGQTQLAVQDAFLILLADPTFRPAPGRIPSWLASVVNRRASSRGAQLRDERPTDALAMLEDRVPPGIPRDQEEEAPV